MKKLVSYILCLSLTAGIGGIYSDNMKKSVDRIQATSLPATGTIKITVIDEETNNLFATEGSSFGIVGSPKGMSAGAGGTIYLGGFKADKKNPCTFENVQTNFSYTVQYTERDYGGYSYYIDQDKSNTEIVFTDSSDLDITIYMKKLVWKETETMVVSGDINSDGTLNVMDAIRFQKWLTGSSDIDFSANKAADLNNDGKINIADFCLLKSLLLSYSNSAVDLLKEKYPQYFDLPTGKGIEVYAWKDTSGDCWCVIMEGTNRHKDIEEISELTPVSSEDAKTILNEYSINKEDVFIIPVSVNQESNLSFEIDKEYSESVLKAFGWNDSESKEKITIDQVFVLADKGTDLTLDDLNEYYEEKHGDNLIFPVDDGTYELMAGYSKETGAFDIVFTNSVSAYYNEASIISNDSEQIKAFVNSQLIHPEVNDISNVDITEITMTGTKRYSLNNSGITYFKPVIQDILTGKNEDSNWKSSSKGYVNYNITYTDGRITNILIIDKYVVIDDKGYITTAEEYNRLLGFAKNAEKNNYLIPE